MVALLATPVGIRIKDLRERKGWTQGQLAKYARVTRSWVSLVESGEIANPGGARLDNVAEQLGVTTHYLINGRQDGERNEVISVPAAHAPVLRNMTHYPVRWVREAEAWLRVRLLEGMTPQEQADHQAARERPTEPGQNDADTEAKGPAAR